MKERILRKCHHSGNSVMISSRLSEKRAEWLYSKSQSIFEELNLDIGNMSIPFADHDLKENRIFQLVGELIHTATVVMRWFEEKWISVLDWPAKSLYVNSMENLKSVMAQKMYRNRRRSSTVSKVGESSVTGLRWYLLKSFVECKKVNAAEIYWCFAWRRGFNKVLDEVSIHHFLFSL